MDITSYVLFRRHISDSFGVSYPRLGRSMQSFTACSVNITSVGRASDVIIASHGFVQSILPLASRSVNAAPVDAASDVIIAYHRLFSRYYGHISPLVHYIIPLASVKKKKKKKKGGGGGVPSSVSLPHFRSVALSQRHTEGNVRSSDPQEMSDRWTHR